MIHRKLNILPRHFSIVPQPDLSPEMANNAMAHSNRAPPEAPPTFGGLTPASIIAETKSILHKSTTLRDQLVSDLSPSTATFASLVRPLADDVNRSACRLRILGTLVASASPDPDLREASRAAEKLILAAEATSKARHDIAALVAAVYRRSCQSSKVNEDRAGELDAQDRYLLAHMFGEYERSGMSIQDESTRSRIQAATAELNELRVAAEKSLTEADDGLWFTRAELGGVPDEELATLEVVKDEGGNTAADRFRLTFRTEHQTYVMRYASSGATRRKFYTAKMRRFPDNVARLAKIVVLRDEIARLLGFENHAALKMEEKMARSVGEVERDLLELRRRLQPLARAEVEKLLALKRRDVDNRRKSAVDIRSEDGSTFYIWDYGYYAHIQRKETYAIDSKALSEYFEARHTLAAMLDFFENLFAMEFEEITASVWHEDVTVYAVWESVSEGGDFLGYLYTDIFGRKGKYQGAHHLLISPVSPLKQILETFSSVTVYCVQPPKLTLGHIQGFVEGSGTRHYAASALVCSFAKADSSNSKPTLLMHSQVRTMFHELGHAIHNIVSRTKYAIPHPRDFIEIPSLMLEHFTWVPEVLTMLGKHYTCLENNNNNNQTEGEVARDGMLIPRRLAEDVARAKYVNRASDLLDDIQLALFDLAIHTPADHDAAQAMDTTALWNTTRQIDGVLSFGDDEDLGFGQGGFPHIFRKYDAGYFAYPM